MTTIDILDKRFVLVFGSSLAGNHRSDTARDAVRFYGAEVGQGEGLYGNSYALPVTDTNLKILPLDVIEKHVDKFFKVAAKHNNKFFLVFRLGCGLAEHTDEDISQLFIQRLFRYKTKNIKLPGMWLHSSGFLYCPRYVIAGSRYTPDTALDIIELTNKELRSIEGATLVSGCCIASPDEIAINYYRTNAKQQLLGLKKFPAPWHADRRYAGILRNKFMAWYSTHLIAIWDGKSTGTKAMIDIAGAGKLHTRTVMYMTENTEI